MVVVLSGGVGGARFLRGLVRVLPAPSVTVLANTGDDIDIYGVRVSPDVDIVTYALAGVWDEERGFGITGDTTEVMDELRAQGIDTWFSLGDRDLGVCTARTVWLERGLAASEIAARIAARFGVRTRIVPMTDEHVHTVIGTDQGEMHFQEYWVRLQAQPVVRSVRLHGVERARPAPGVVEAIAAADAVLIAPSNPVVSVGTILAVPGMREALRSTPAPVVGVSPIVGGRVLRGMADKLMPVLGAEVSARGVAALYEDILDGFVLDERDEAQVRDIACATEVTDTVMRSQEDAARVAKAALALAGRLP